jgi:arsenite-transporting ATPase
VELTGEPRVIPTRRGTLLAAELAAGPALARWMAAHREPLREIAARGTYLDAGDVDRFLGLSLPGADELMAWLEIARLARRTARDEVLDEVIVDAAPTAHTLRLLAMPEALRRFAAVLDHLQERHRWMAERFGGAWRPDASDALVADLEAQGREIEERLRDPERCGIFWVMLPEILSLEETRDALAALDVAGIPVREVIVNRVTARDGEVIAEIRTALAGRTMRFLPEAEREPVGKAALRRIAKALAAPLPEPSPPGPLSRPLPPSLTGRGEKRQESLEWLEEIAPVGLQLLFFGGKGGVGKTTAAATAAISIARRGDRVLLLSTDPAHSIGDVLDTAVGDQEREIEPRLWAREPDAARAFERRREKYRTAVEELFAALRGGSSFDAPYDRAVMEDLIELAPPGLDELFSLLAVIEALQRYPVVVVDTAPTGHALRLLELVEKAREWVQVLLQIQLKYRRVTGLGELARDLTGTARELRELQQLLVDPRRSRFVAVTRAAALPREETARLLSALKRLRIATPALLVNAITPPGCSRCRRAAAAEEEELRRLRRIRRGCAMLGAPWIAPAPRGGEALARFGRTWTRME